MSFSTKVRNQLSRKPSKPTNFPPVQGSEREILPTVITMHASYDASYFINRHRGPFNAAHRLPRYVDNTVFQVEVHQRIVIRVLQ